MKLVGQTKAGLIVYRLSNNKYDMPHQGKRERARRLKRLIAHPEERTLDMNEADLVTTYLELQR